MNATSLGIIITITVGYLGAIYFIANQLGNRLGAVEQTLLGMAKDLGRITAQIDQHDSALRDRKDD